MVKPCFSWGRRPHGDGSEPVPHWLSCRSLPAGAFSSHTLKTWWGSYLDSWGPSKTVATMIFSLGRQSTFNPIKSPTLPFRCFS